MLDTDPQRIGHAFYLNDKLVDMMTKMRIPLECCLTSGVYTNTIKNHGSHPAFITLKKNCEDYPVIICTDDSGVFLSTLSDEYYQAALSYNLTKEQLIEIARCSVRYSFISGASKKAVEEEFEKRIQALV
eukprot:TRINITY_DN20818_c0_g1_i1.p1 TRINITY_DN20818_c0_g1~~TRINITY_DN20818_c0_g1_i1.p1  ORF type:complete len:130 (+),score=30.74 TRINITY_DN20818_c0_g1_i1:136-525(+)